MNEHKVVRTRFAPSPTGYLHIGSLRTALFSYLYAKHTEGKFILRIEDTDQARFIEGTIEKIIDSLHQMGLDYDEGVVVRDNALVDAGEFGPYQQSKRRLIYIEYAKKLVAEKNAYYCFCDEQRLNKLRKEQGAQKKAPMYDRKCRNLSEQEVQENHSKGMSYAIRQAIPLHGQTIVKDLVFKEIVWENKVLDDQILLKSDGFPTYHLAVVVDDHLMQISHVIRGDEWIPSTPKHVLLYNAFGWKAPEFAHLPLILNSDRSKLSKRQGDVAVEDYLAKGYLKEALINFVALLGWNPKTDQEIFSLKELIKQFDFTKVNKSGAVFDVEKLDWINSLYIRSMDIDQLTKQIMPYLLDANLIKEQGGLKYAYLLQKEVQFDYIKDVIRLERERLKKLSEIGDRVRYFFESPQYEPQLLIWKKSNLQQTKDAINAIKEFVSALNDEDFLSRSILQDKVKTFVSEKALDNGSVLWPLRVALSGMEFSPSPFEIMEVLHKGLGKSEILARLKTALTLLE